MTDSYWILMNAKGAWTFLCLLFVCGSLYLSFLNLRRSGGGRRLFMLEGLRIVVVLMLALTLLQPEHVTIEQSEREPVVAILSDGSASMRTEDVTTNRQSVISRETWVTDQLNNPIWASLEEAGNAVVFETFSDSPANTQTVAFTEKYITESEGTDINSALDSVMQAHNNLRAVLIMSDGDWNMGDSPVMAATRLSQRRIPVYSIAVGHDRFLPDLVLQSVTAPSYGLVEEHIAIPFSIRSHLDRDVKTSITLKSQHGVETYKDITIPAMSLFQDTIVWSPKAKGDHQLTLSFPKHASEYFENNNAKSFSIGLRRELLKVLVVESLPRWEFRYLRNALMRDPGVEVDCVLLHPGMSAGSGDAYLPSFPESRDRLSEYDVVFLGDVGVGMGELTQEQCEQLKGLIDQQGSGLVFLPGPRGRIDSLMDSPLKELLPVEIDQENPQGFGYDRSSQIQLTSHGRGHLLTMLASSEMQNYEVWKQLPGFYWYAPVVKNRPGSQVLAVHSTRRNKWGRIPLLVTRPQGSGKVLFMGTDGAWRWRRGVEDKYHYRFWGQVVRWMAHQRHLSHDEGIRVFFTPEQPTRGEKVFLHATVFDKDGFPLNEGPVFATIKSASGKMERTSLTPEPGGWGVFKGSFNPTEGGVYDISVRSDIAGREITTPIEVQAPHREKLGQPAKVNVMREISGITGGKWGSTDDLASIVRDIRTLEKPRPLEDRNRLWCHPAWLGLVVAMLAVYWTTRKLFGVV
jgi:hypothetical protein